MADLRPCPFCGSTSHTRRMGRVVCLECGAHGPPRNGLTGEAPAAAWNRRERDDLVDDLRDALALYAPMPTRRCALFDVPGSTSTRPAGGAYYWRCSVCGQDATRSDRLEHEEDCPVRLLGPVLMGDDR